MLNYITTVLIALNIVASINSFATGHNALGTFSAVAAIALFITTYVLNDG